MELKYRSFNGKYYDSEKKCKAADLKWAVDLGHLVFIDYYGNLEDSFKNYPYKIGILDVYGYKVLSNYKKEFNKELSHNLFTFTFNNKLSHNLFTFIFGYYVMTDFGYFKVAESKWELIDALNEYDNLFVMTNVEGEYLYGYK